MKKKSKTSSIQLHHEGVDLPLLQPLPNYAVYESNAEEILFPLKRVMVRCFVKAPWHLVVNLWFVFGSTPTPPSQITTLKHFLTFFLSPKWLLSEGMQFDNHIPWLWWHRLLGVFTLAFESNHLNHKATIWLWPLVWWIHVSSFSTIFIYEIWIIKICMSFRYLPI